MDRLRVGCGILLLLSLVTVGESATPATFRGRVVRSADARPGLIYVLGQRGSLRKVEVTHARVRYADTVPTRLRQPEPASALVQGTEVRVQAEDAGSGLWHALSIEILSLPSAPPASGGELDQALPPGYPPLDRRHALPPGHPPLDDPERPQGRRSIA